MASEPPVLEPSSQWHLDTGDERCRLAREFGEGAAKHILFLEMDEPSAYVGFLLAGPAMEELDLQVPVRLQFGNLEPIVLDRHTQGSLEGYGAALMSTGISLDENFPAELEETGTNESSVTEAPKGLPRLASERFTNVETLTIAQEDAEKAVLKLPSLHKALEALNLCSEDFITYWGLDLEQHRSMQRGPKWTNSQRVVRRIAANYPSAALRKGEQGSVRFLLIIDETGQVEECRQSNVTLLDKLESPACKIMRRGEFEPALDADGNPMRSYYASQIRYVLP
ncbi:energy transducer TonB [Qipengyuania sphaerica]|uniref:energy transducer TonB n=1 Tax=Qipengyuania sphaerica TaxID=2867243 RepID=UPI001C86C31D|nr:energy transducer TonB [Qipengyuania sphaerica]MBX7541457.1 energy transducer TonB [Qipengyuania sphaerica]